jgi:hypothetical protein
VEIKRTGQITSIRQSKQFSFMYQIGVELDSPEIISDSLKETIEIVVNGEVARELRSHVAERRTFTITITDEK